MDLTERKNKFIEKFMQINSDEKLQRLEDFLCKEVESEEEIVAYTVKGEPSKTSQNLRKRIRNNEITELERDVEK